MSGKLQSWPPGTLSPSTQNQASLARTPNNRKYQTKKLLKIRVAEFLQRTSHGISLWHQEQMANYSFHLVLQVANEPLLLYNTSTEYVEWKNTSNHYGMQLNPQTRNVNPPSWNEDWTANSRSKTTLISPQRLLQTFQVLSVHSTPVGALYSPLDALPNFESGNFKYSKIMIWQCSHVQEHTMSTLWNTFWNHKVQGRTQFD